MAGLSVMNLMQAEQGDVNVSLALDIVNSVSAKSDGAFSTIMEKNISVVRQTDEKNASPVKVESDELTDETGLEYEKFRYKNQNVAQTTEESPKDMALANEELLDSMKSELLEVLSEDLGVSVEDIEKVLEQLGMSVFELMTPQNLVEFVKQFSGMEESLDCLTNENFYSLYEDVTNLVTEFVSDSGFSVEEIQDMADVLADVKQFEEVISDAVEKLPEGPENVMSSTETETDYEPMDVPETEITEEPVAVPVEHTRENGSKNSSDTLFERHSEDKSFVQTLSTVQPQNMNSNMTMENFFEHVSSYKDLDVQRILDQIVERVKVNVSNEVSSIEMQLNPENLGKVYMNISSKEGTINAQFYAQNDAVREALEMQIATLKVNLNQAGIKVDAIEVSVGTHEFEQNLEQNERREEEKGQYQEELFANRRRNIRLDDLEGLTGIMSEEEALVAQMMLAHGNSIDLSA